ncbi:FAD dependent oxidoreductase [Delphinella strobiligena]|nr:FAD dependent oxidoreductase [Delphinella strobiligena]
MTSPAESESKSSIIIVGAGVFGLTSALHLARRGYKNIHIFDKQPFHLNGYAFSAGCDGASADENKILRASYGSGKLYQDMAFSAMKEWEAWNRDIGTATDLPSTLSNDDKLWENCGFLRVGEEYDDQEVKTQKNFPVEIKHTQYRIGDPQRVSDAIRAGIPRSKLDPFNRQERGLKTDGVLDMTAGFVLASKACTYALHLCQKAGVTLHLGPGIGQFTSFLQNGGRVTGITTLDGTTHLANQVIVACGGWTPSLIPFTSHILETTAGSILTIQLPATRPDLWAKYSPANFPVWSWRTASHPGATSNGGLYAFPRTQSGLIKFGFRGVKFTNYTWRPPGDSTAISYPRTDLDRVPQIALETVRSFCAENLPDLLDLELQRGRLCWYTDSVLVGRREWKMGFG